MTRKSVPFRGAESVLDPLTIESEMRIAALRAADRAAAATAPPQPMESRDPLADVLALYTDPPRRPSPLSAITVGSYAASIRQAAQQLRQIPGVAAQARAADTLPALMSPVEARLLQALGGSGRIDRYGVRHFDNPALMPDSVAADPMAFGPSIPYPPPNPPQDLGDQPLSWPGTLAPQYWGPATTAGLDVSQDTLGSPNAADPTASVSQPVFQLPVDGGGGGLVRQLLGIGTAQAQGIGSGRGRGAPRIGPGGNELSANDELMMESYNNGLNALRSIEPNNRLASGSIASPNWVPNRNDVEDIWNEVAAAKARTASGGPSATRNPFGTPALDRSPRSNDTQNDQAQGRAQQGNSKAVKDLEPLHSPETVGQRPDLKRLSDEELLKSVTDPKERDPIKIDTETGKIIDGNSRAYELKNRAADPNSSITPDTRVPFEPYTKDNSMFKY